MAPKKNKELSLAEFAAEMGVSTSDPFGEDEENYLPDLDGPLGNAPGAASMNWRADSYESRGPRAEVPIPDSAPWSIRISNLPLETEREGIIEFLQEHALTPEDVRVPRANADRPSMTAFVDLASREDLVKALALSGQRCLGRSVGVSVAERRMQSNSAFGGGSFDWSERGQVMPSKFENSRFENRGFDNKFENNGRFGSRFGDRFGDAPAPSKFESSFNWGEREQPPMRQFQPREPREPRERSQFPQLDGWGEREQPPQQRRARAPEPEFDWTARVPQKETRQARPNRKFGKKEWNAGEADWSSGGAGAGIGATTGASPFGRARPVSAVPANAPETRESSKQEQARRLKSLKKSGFSILDEA